MTDQAPEDDSDEIDAEFAVPEGCEPVVCPYCSMPLSTERQRSLHIGLEHYHESTDHEQEAFRAAYAEEEKALSRFRIVALGGLVALYFGFLLVYALLAV